MNRLTVRALIYGIVFIVLFGCSTSKTMIPYDGPEKTSSVKTNILTALDYEWRQFGSQTARYDWNGLSVERSGLSNENSPKARARIRRYWSAVDDHVTPKNMKAVPWSAAFISWVLKWSGADDSDFEPSAAHSRYLLPLIQNARYDADAKLVPHNIGRYQPKPGDLLCAGRAGVKVPSLSRLYSTATTHCDFVYKVQDGKLYVVGGNVGNSVTLSSIPLDKNFQPLPVKNWFAWVENRYD